MEPRFVRHLGVHSGGVVLSAQPLTHYSPLLRSSGGIRMLTFDKDDAEALGLVKLDLLGLRMLAALERAREEVFRLSGEWVDFGRLPDDPGVWERMSLGDTMGLFQIESPAQQQMAARLRPRSMTELPHQIALVRPGPIQSDLVHPYVRRARGEEPVPEMQEPLRSILAPTHGVLLFQEQILRIARHFSGYSWGEADRYAQARLLPVALHDLLHAPHGVRPTPLGLKEVHVPQVGGEVDAQHQAEGLGEQEVAVLTPLALVHENFAGGEVHLAHLDLHQPPDTHGGEEQQLEQDLVLDPATCTDGVKEAGQLLSRQELGRLAFPPGLLEAELLPGLLADIAQLVVGEPLLAGEADELGDEDVFGGEWLLPAIPPSLDRERAGGGTVGLTRTPGRLHFPDGNARFKASCMSSGRVVRHTMRNGRPGVG